MMSIDMPFVVSPSAPLRTGLSNHERPPAYAGAQGERIKLYFRNMIGSGMDENEAQEARWAYERAERIVAEKVGFLRHLTIYVVVNALLFAINMLTSSGFLWFLIPLGGWGIVLLAHFLGVFTFRGDRFERWRKRQIEKEMEKLRGKD